MKRCVIIAACMQDKISEVVNLCTDDFIICADGGYSAAAAEDITPNLVLGDFDSLCTEVPQGIEVERVAAEKDDTDTLLCLKRGIDMGFDEFVILGGMGGRLDHTIANLQAAAYGRQRGCFVLLASKRNLAAVIADETVNIPRMDGWKLSVFAFGARCEGVCEAGVKYPLNDAVLENTFPIGVSNEITGEYAEVSCKNGQLLIILSKD